MWLILNSACLKSTIISLIAKGIFLTSNAVYNIYQEKSSFLEKVEFIAI